MDSDLESTLWTLHIGIGDILIFPSTILLYSVDDKHAFYHIVTEWCFLQICIRLNRLSKYSRLLFQVDPHMLINISPLNLEYPLGIPALTLPPRLFIQALDESLFAYRESNKIRYWKGKGPPKWKTLKSQRKLRRRIWTKIQEVPLRNKYSLSRSAEVLVKAWNKLCKTLVWERRCNS